MNSRRGAAAARRVHTPEVVRASRTAATTPPHQAIQRASGSALSCPLLYYPAWRAILALPPFPPVSSPYVTLPLYPGTRPARRRGWP